jgi:hypothetical protein
MLSGKISIRQGATDLESVGILGYHAGSCKKKSWILSPPNHLELTDPTLSIDLGPILVLQRSDKRTMAWATVEANTPPSNGGLRYHPFVRWPWRERVVSFLDQTEHIAAGGMTMMNDEEFRQFLTELRSAYESAYGLPPKASGEDTADYEDFLTEDDHVSQSPSHDGRWRQED